MKTMILILLCAACPVMGAEIPAGDVPAEVRRLIESRDREVARINERMLRELERIRSRYEQAGKSDVVRKIDGVFGTGEFSIDGKWQVYYDGKKEDTPREFRDGMMVVNGEEARVTRHGDRVILTKWGKWHETLIVTDDPRVMIGTNKGGHFLRAEKVD